MCYPVMTGSTVSLVKYQSFTEASGSSSKHTHKEHETDVKNFDFSFFGFDIICQTMIEIKKKMKAAGQFVLSR